MTSSQRRWLRIRRVLDAVLAAVLLGLLGVPMLVIAAAIRIGTPGPALFRQRRLGIHQRPFTTFKFRTMYEGATSAAHERYIADLAQGRVEAEPRELKKLFADPRVTRTGALLRKTSLDELPQLLNVLAGDMSLTGPRPALDYELPHYRPEHFARFEVPPGLTGLWQVSGRSFLGFTDMLDLDAAYARRVSPRLDLKILLRTPGALFGRTA